MAIVFRDVDGHPTGLSPRVWVQDEQLGTEVLVVDDNLYLSYRNPARSSLDRSKQFEWMAELGVPGDREETAILRRRRPCLILVGDHRKELHDLSRQELVRYYDLSRRKCYQSPESWSEKPRKVRTALCIDCWNRCSPGRTPVRLTQKGRDEGLTEPCHGCGGVGDIFVHLDVSEDPPHPNRLKVMS